MSFEEKNEAIQSNPEMSLEDAIRTRRSVRGYLDKEVPEKTMTKIFSLAQEAPSNCNIIPWKVFVASGECRDNIAQGLVEVVNQGKRPDADFPQTLNFKDEYRTRQVACAVELYNNMGIERDDKQGRMRASLRNFELFDAPHVAFICMEKYFDVSVAIDVGMYIQNLMLAMTAQGVSCCPMGSMRHYPFVAREVLNIPDNLGILLGVTFGYEDTTVPANKTRMLKDDISTNVQFFS